MKYYVFPASCPLPLIATLKAVYKLVVRGTEREPLMSQRKRKRERDKETQRCDSVQISSLCIQTWQRVRLLSPFWYLSPRLRDNKTEIPVVRQERVMPANQQTCTGEKVSNYKSGNKPTWLWAWIVIKKVRRFCFSVIPVHLEQSVWPWACFIQKASHVAEKLHFI